MSQPRNPQVDMQLRSVVDGLVNHTAGAIPRQQVTELVDQIYDRMAATATIDTFLPVLVGKEALRRLEQGLDAAQVQLQEAPEVLIVCQSNAGRSQAAAAMLRHYAPGELLVVAAGIEPAAHILPGVVDGLASHGLHLLEQPQRYSPQMLEAAAHVVVIGEVTETFEPRPGQDLHVWDDIALIDDAAGAEVAATLSAIEERVRDLIGQWYPHIDLGEPLMRQPADPA